MGVVTVASALPEAYWTVTTSNKKYQRPQTKSHVDNIFWKIISCLCMYSNVIFRSSSLGKANFILYITHVKVNTFE